ncbi:hypothetical protein DL766_001857 [Monosporascus sp. MC13-8B]|uniref:NAD(P)-binding protein n=1 Tax=Monosporascus cannonballus TaxID=155416 RepID=A0ABY0H6W0_9PEZI|nr:hypothetical protein DL762_005806 [Monosporascus cannonballus]RYP36740.1 hypothetical protein DL766_001857 [Monosporascus sp. MC13-8B]
MLGSSNKFDPNTDIPDLTGKVYVVTGGSAGIGYGISAHILQHNPEKLYLIGKREQHLEEAEEGLKKYRDISRIELLQCDFERLDALILNAGEGVGPYSETKDDIDSHMQVNVIAQHHLAMLLLPKLLSTPDSRLCFQASELHRTGTSGVEFKDLAEINQDIGATSLYGRMKLAMILRVKALTRRKQRGELSFRPGAAPWINATHPGGVRTDQNFQMTEAYGLPSKLGIKAIRPFMKDPVDEGCRSILFAATSNAISEEKIDGQYIVRDRKVTSPSSQTGDEELQERCWNLVEHILASKLGPLPYANRV